MRVHSLRVVLLAVCVFSAVSVFADPAPDVPDGPKESYGATLAKSAGSSIASSAGLMIAKELTGQFYDATCAKEVVKDTAEKYFCSALAGFSGRSEQEWKAKLQEQLTEINGKLDKLEKAQEKMQFDLGQNHKKILSLLKQAAAEQIATQHEVSFDSLWTRYKRQFDKVDEDVTHDAMVKFAKVILSEKLDKKLAAYNSVLTKSYRGNQALLRYPFFAYKAEYEFRSQFFNHDKKFQGIYEGAEEAFMDARAQQEKVVLMVLWAIKVLELDCQLKKPCEAPPFTSREFMKDVDADTQDQLKAFNEGVDWLFLTYSEPHFNTTYLLPYEGQDFLTRANYLNAAVLSKHGAGSEPTQMGMWGRVISMGNAWDGTINLQCGATGGAVKPRFSYVVNVDGRDKPKAIDWWISRAGNNVYDEVHFAPEWKVYHYWIPSAALGPCTLSASLPGKGIIPYVQAGTEVMRVSTVGNPAIVGSFLGIQRAGGSYAMGSGNQWRARREPVKSDDGTTAVIEKRQDEWSIDPSGPYAKVGFLFAGRGEYKVRFSGGGGRVHKSNLIYLYSEKKIWFPDDRNVRLHLFQGPACAKTCAEGAGDSTYIVDYNIENGGTAEKEKGKLTSVVSVFLDPRVGNVDSPNAGTLRDAAKGRGVYIDGSYGATSERKTQKVDPLADGALTTDPSAGYQLQYLMDFDLETEGSGIGKTEWSYRSKITPALVYLTK